MIRRVLVLALLAVAFCTEARADYLEVRRSATIKEDPHRDADVLVRPEVGSFLELLDNGAQSSGYYHVSHPESGEEGWIYRTLVRRHPGSIPDDGDGGGGGGSTDPANIVDVYWWNIRDFSDGSRDDSELAKIAKTLKGAEVVAIGELNDTQVLGRLAAKMGSTWLHAASAKVGRSSHTAEHYGFIWDSSVVDIVGNVSVDTATEDTIDREPAWATFKTTDNRLDFTIISIHVTWGSTVGPRKKEIRELDGVWDRVQTATTTDDDLILVGDFNRNVGDDSFDEVLGISGMVRVNEDTPSTHISSTSTYDQMFLSTDNTSEWNGSWVTHKFDETVFGGDDAKAKTAGSDHRPVSLSLSIPGADDD